MRVRWLLGTFVAVAFALVFHRPLAAQAPSDTTALHNLAREFSAAYVRGDAAALTALYTADAVLFPERSDRIEGRDAILKYSTPSPGQRITRHVLTPARIVVEGAHAYDYGTYEIAGERDGVAWGPAN